MGESPTQKTPLFCFGEVSATKVRAYPCISLSLTLRGEDGGEVSPRKEKKWDLRYSWNILTSSHSLAGS